MKTKDHLLQSQPIAYKTLHHGFESKTASHAFLLSGRPGSPLLESAIFIAQSILCEHPSPLACEECLSCIRVSDESYADYVLLNGAKGSIKKDEIEQLQSQFFKTALERNGNQVYIIHLVEKATPGAINSLLKGLEEPSKTVTAILTTENITKVLDTIVSRCQVIRLKAPDKSILISLAKENGLEATDAALLAEQYSDLESVMEAVNNPHYHHIKDLVIDTIRQWGDDLTALPYFVQRELNPHLSSKNDCIIYLDLLTVAWKDLLRLSNDQEIVFQDQRELLERIHHDSKFHATFLKHLLVARGSFDYNVNSGLVLDQLAYRMVQEGGNQDE